MRKRFPFILLLILSAIICIQCNSKERSREKDFQTKPNIIILLADDMGYGDLSSYGHPTIRTPNIDRLATQGIRFTSFEASPWCVPSRAQLLTGVYAPRVHFGGGTGAGGHGGLPDSILTLAEGLKKAGYVTGMAGKWHLGYDPKKYLPTNQGFDSWLGLPYSNDYKKPYVQTDVPLVMYRGTKVVEYPVNQDSLTVTYTQEAIRFIGEHGDKEQPFFFYLAYNMPHLPIHTTKEFYGDSKAGLYGDVVETIDWSVGQVLETLKNESIAQNTIIFFSSDNGPWKAAPPRMFKIPKDPEGSNWRERWKSHGPGNRPWDAGSTGPLRGYKHTVWEGGTRVPGIIRWPGHIQPGQMSSALVTNLDIFRTFLAIGGGKLPDYRLDGYNMMPFFTGKIDNNLRNRYAYFIGDLLALRVGNWKLKVGPGGQWQLFNLALDVGENYNRANEKPQLVNKMKVMMDSVANSVGVKVAEKPVEESVPRQTSRRAYHKVNQTPRYNKRLRRAKEILSEPPRRQDWKWGKHPELNNIY